MENLLKIELSNWQYNAGIVGLYNILNYAGEESLILKDNAMYFDIQALDNFEEKYFKYLIDSYEKVLSWYRIVSFERRIEFFRKQIKTDEGLKDKEVKEINTYVKDVLKKYLKSASYIKAYKCMDNTLDLIAKEKEIKTITIKKSESIKDKEEEFLELFNKITEIIDCLKLENARKHIGGKNVTYQIIKNAWDGVSLLNPQTKEKDIYKDLGNYFVSPVLEYLKEDKAKYKYSCFVCDREIKNLNNDFSFLTNTGFDTARKPSHVWNFNNDIAMCPICKLVYSCIPAGFVYVYDTGLFVNANSNIGELIRINSKIMADIYKEDLMKDIYKALNYELQDEQKYELEDIQLIRFENGKYYFNIISKDMIRVFNKSKKDFKLIDKMMYSLNKKLYSVSKEVTRKILNNENLFGLIHMLLYSYVRGSSMYLYEYGIFSVIKINFRILGGLGYMENKDIKMLSRSRSAGINLKKKFESKNAEHKLQGICYRLLNGIKTNNTSMVMDTVLNSYLYCSESVPKIVMEMMEEEEVFKELGYAFVSGLLAKEYKGNDEDDKEEKYNTEEGDN